MHTIRFWDIETSFIPKLIPFWEEERRFKLAYGGRGGGKSESIARMLLANSFKYNNKIILCSRQYQVSIKDSVHSLLKGIIQKNNQYSELFEITRDEIRNTATGTTFIFKGLERDINAVRSINNIQYCWVEEAHTLKKETLDVLIPSIRADKSEIWFSFNRFLENDAVYVYFQGYDNALYIKVNYTDNPFLPEVLKNESEALKLKNYDDYLHVWAGEPIGQEFNAILHRTAVLRAIDMDITSSGDIFVGADIARYGDDRTVFIKRQGLKMIDYKIIEKQDLITVARELINFANGANITVDDTGVGGGVTDYLRDQSIEVNAVNFASSAQEDDKYSNIISEMWFTFRDKIENASLINIDGLVDELSARLYTYDNKGRQRVEKKDDFKKRYGKSPDLADALLLCYYDSTPIFAFF